MQGQHFRKSLYILSYFTEKITSFWHSPKRYSRYGGQIQDLPLLITVPVVSVLLCNIKKGANRHL
jgi:hypothetical protein